MAHTDTQTTHGHRNLETELAQWADSVKMDLIVHNNVKLFLVEVFPLLNRLGASAFQKSN